MAYVLTTSLDLHCAYPVPGESRASFALCIVSTLGTFWHLRTV